MSSADLPPQGDRRVVIENVEPSCDHGIFPVKSVIGDPVDVAAHVFADGHDTVRAVLRHRPISADDWTESDLEARPNDEWQGRFFPQEIGIHEYSIAAWIDSFLSWRNGFRKKVDSAQPLNVEVEIGAEMTEALEGRATPDARDSIADMVRLLREPAVPMGEKVHLLLGEELLGFALSFPDRGRETVLPPREVWVERKRAAFGSWYEFFPRSFAREPGAHGTFDEARRMLDHVASLGFHVVYLPPIHPIGKTRRKGRNNALQAEPGDVGSPWAIGSAEGGHKDVHPALGTLKGFRDFVWKAGELGMEVALDIAFQCSPDHPYVREHPEWFKWRPDGSVQFAENPPKRYEDFIPFDFECEDWRGLWRELKSVLDHWIDCGIRVFRIDNPHTKPFAFWRWAIRDIKTRHPDVLFLSEAFTRPKLKYRLGKSGFTHGYTYFSWRNTKDELEGYLRELLAPERRKVFWPHFWPNTPDILPEILQFGGRPAFVQRLVLAATLSSNYGMYGPAFEQCVSAAYPGKEEYDHSEKYEIKVWDLDAPGNLRSIIRRINHIRRDHPALQRTFNLRFVETDNPRLIAYLKHDPSRLDIILTVVNLDPYHEQTGWIFLPLEDYGIDADHPFLVQDLLPEPGEGDMPRANYLWSGARNFIKLNPHACPAHIFRLFRKQRKEEDFDYWL